MRHILRTFADQSSSSITQNSAEEVTLDAATGGPMASDRAVNSKPSANEGTTVVKLHGIKQVVFFRIQIRALYAFAKIQFPSTAHFDIGISLPQRTRSYWGNFGKSLHMPQ